MLFDDRRPQRHSGQTQFDAQTVIGKSHLDAVALLQLAHHPQINFRILGWICGRAMQQHQSCTGGRTQRFDGLIDLSPAGTTSRQ